MIEDKVPMAKQVQLCYKLEGEISERFKNRRQTEGRLYDQAQGQYECANKTESQDISVRNDGAKLLSPLPVKSQPTGHGNVPTQTSGRWKSC